MASELVECGRARLQRAELEEARDAFQKASKESGDRRLQREARYWLGQTLLRLGRASEAESELALVVQDDPRSEFGPYAADDLGWNALDRKDPRRAFTYFDNLIKSGVPPALAGHAYHGRAMVTKTGFVAAILDHHGPESYLLQFSFAATKTVGEATLVRIATAGNPDDGVASRSGEECMNAGQAGQPLTLPVLGAPSQEPRLQLLDPQRHHGADRAQHEKGHHHVRGIEGAARLDGEAAHDHRCQGLIA